MLQAALTLLRCYDFGQDGARAAASEHLLIDEADADVAANGVIKVADVEAWLDSKLESALERNRAA